MALITDRKELYVEQTQRKPNRYAANVLIGIVIVISIVCFLNEIGVFEISKNIVRFCLAFSVVIFLIAQYIVHSPSRIDNPISKYIIMFMVLLLVLAITVLLNIHAVLAFILPLLLATQYRSYTVSKMALFGSILCCGIAPVLSYLYQTWNLVFMTGYVETFCRVTIEVTPGNTDSFGDALWQIALFWALPQMLTICAFGIILFTATKISVDSVTHQLQVVDLSNDLNTQLESILSMQEKVLYSMSDIIENRDVETGDHVKRTSEIVKLLLDEIRKDSAANITDDFYNAVIRSAPMHDLGKISIPDAILRKPGQLTDEEFAIVKLHPEKSAQIIEQVLTGIESDSLLVTATNLAKYHHERFDGKGYPEGLKGKEIPLEARIMAIADVYDALVSERCYKAPMAFDEAYETIENSMGTQFDPDLNRFFLACRKDIEKYYS